MNDMLPSSMREDEAYGHCIEKKHLSLRGHPQ